VTESGPSTYDEPARSYTALWIVFAFFAAGMTLDGALGGLVAHLIGWAVALALVGGVFFLFIYAARSEKSLHLSVAELRVGDEAVPRSEVVAVAADSDDDELPVLGWPTGAPRGVKAVTVRLADGRDVVVPARYPDQLVAALGVGAVTAVRTQDVRSAARSELALLVEIDERADALFRTAGMELPAVPYTEDDLAGAKAVFVAGRPPIGFVHVDEVDGLAHVTEIAVIPKWMRQGIGSRLLDRACEWAREHEYPAMTLTTFADVSWNAPYYAARGFVEVVELTPGLAALRAREAELGLDEVGRRITMRRDLR
jgi:ribosomal protein S18 acetylase RimI-like enzyme